MNPTSKKLISLFLVFSLMMLSVNLYSKEKRGATLIITKKDGQQIRGELITVKSNSLLLLNTEGKDVSVGLADINVIHVIKKSKALLGAGIGALALGVVPASVVSISFSNPDDPELRWVYAGIVAFLGGLGGLLLGGLIGAAAGTDKSFQLEGMTDSEIQEALDKLRMKARVRDYR